MQFSVPQFTDVEDKIIGSLTIKQFGIIFAAGVIVFLSYSATKSMTVLIAAALLVGLPAAAIAFAKINGRPMYTMFGHVFKFMMSPKILVFHKETVRAGQEAKKEDVQVKKTVEALTPSDPQSRLKEVNRLLTQKAQEEEELLKRTK